MERNRKSIFLGTIFAAVTLLGAQLFLLQIVNNEQFHDVSEGNALRDERILPARGGIYDRNGVLMVDNEPLYTITLTPRYFDDAQTGFLAGLLGVADSVVTSKLKEAQRWNSYRPSPSFRGVPFQTYSRILENSYHLPGVGHEITYRRRYLSEAGAAHVLGYIREITDSELGAYNEEYGVRNQYRQGDFVGKTGVERRYESYLRGEPGVAFRVINVHGLEVKPYREGQNDEAPTTGYDAHLALDIGVQALAESLFVNKRGAAVAMDVKTGGLIAMVSMPDFDLAIFSSVMDRTTWAYLNGSEDKPLYNRATMNRMPPGSTWKPFMSLMALDRGLITLEGQGSTYSCPGYHPRGYGKIFRCLHVHGPQNVRQAIKNSCNTFFFEMAYRTDVNTFKRYADMFGFGVKAPTDIAEQTAGLIPDSAYYDARYSYWGWGHTMNLGVGQGDMGVTPLQLARYAAAVANDGSLYAPHLVDSLHNKETGDTIFPFDDVTQKTIPISKEYFSIVRDGMRLVMEEGTGVGAQIPGIPSGGKTGTAQAPGGRRDHSVFIMFAPLNNPKIAVAVQCENAGYGGSCAAPIASLMAERYLKGELPDTPEVRYRMSRALNAKSQILSEENGE